MGILIIGLTAKPLIHHYAHEHNTEHASALHCNCGSEHDSESPDKENGNSHCSSGEKSDHHSCCSGDNPDANCGDEGHQCDGHCRCAFSITSNFSIEKTEPITIAEFSIIRKYIFISEYHFELPNLIWNPPKFISV